MADPPSKKQKTLVDLSDVSSPPAAAAETVSNSKDVAPKTRTSRAARQSASTSLGTAAASSKSRPRPAKPKAATAPPKRSLPPAKSKKKFTGKYKSLHSFFGIPQGAVSPPPPSLPPPATTAAPKTRIQSVTPLPVEDADDLIEDVSDEDEDVVAAAGRKRRLTTKKGFGSSLQAHIVVSKPGVACGARGLLATKHSHSSQVTAPAGVAKKPEDTRTWPEKYAPQTAEALALNKTKVKEVRTWLEGVLGRSSRKRVLVLKGAAGTGKTATVNALAKEMGVEILEWRNPHGATEGAEYGEEGAFAAGLSGIFEEFVGRAGTFGSLDLVSSTGKEAAEEPPASSSQNASSDDRKNKLIVIEDFPNTLFTSSPTPLQSFRRTLKCFLALPTPPPEALPLPPLILIITETASISGPNSFTAYRLLSPEILHHPLVSEIGFNKIAPTFMYRALNSIVMQESRDSGRKFGPSKAVLDALSTSGDIRSAIMGLEFLAMNNDLPGSGFSENIVAQRKSRKKPMERQLTAKEQRMMDAVTQRESTYGIFHAVGKVLYNKRFGDDPEDEYYSPPPRPPLDTLPYHSRRARVDLETLIDDTGTDPQTFLSGLHENYLGSCNPGGVSRLPSSDEDVLDTVNLCLDYLSDSDVLASRGFGHDYLPGDTTSIRADELSFHTGVRGLMMSLPSPVKRFLEPKGGANKMFYPTSARLWRDRQEVAEVVDWFVGKQRQAGPCNGGTFVGLVERLPYMSFIVRGWVWAWRLGGAVAGAGAGAVAGAGAGIGVFATKLQSRSFVVVDLPTIMALEKATVFNGVGRRSEDPADEDGDGGEDTDSRRKWKAKNTVTWAEEEIRAGGAVEGLVLSDDDIEEF